MNKKILIVEDEVSLLTALTDKFTREKFTVLTSINGKDGLKSALSNHPDIILLDIVMPIMDGITMLHKLRDDDWGKSVKIILLTNLSNPQPGKVTKSLIKSASGYLVKSDWKIVDVVNQVNKLLE